MSGVDTILETLDKIDILHDYVHIREINAYLENMERGRFRDKHHMENYYNRAFMFIRNHTHGEDRRKERLTRLNRAFEKRYPRMK